MRVELIQLAGHKLLAAADASFSFWRGFAADFLRALWQGRNKMTGEGLQTVKNH